MSHQACIRLADDAPLSNAALQKLMAKTYTDTYKVLGFAGGNWTYAVNANESAGVPLSEDSEDLISEEERRPEVYFLGWESIEVSDSCPVG